MAEHRGRIVELKAALHDLAAERAATEAELDAERTVLATLEALAAAASESPAAPVTRRGAARQEG